MRSLPRLVAAVVLVLALTAALAPAAEARGPRVVVAFLPSGGQDNPGAVLDRLAARPELALALLSATQGRYWAEQAVLDISAGTRTSAAAYDPTDPPELELVRGGDGSGFVFGWSFAVDRARSAPAEIVPGLLAATVPGGAGYAGVKSRRQLESVVAADRDGDVAELSLGTSAQLPGRVRDLLARHRLVVAALPTGSKGDAALGALLAGREAGDLVIALETPPRVRSLQLLPVGVAGLGATGALTSATTRLRGIVAGIDVTATVLDHLGIALPAVVKGQPLEVRGTVSTQELQSFEDRLSVVRSRRFPAIELLLASCLALALALALVRDRPGLRAGMRIGSLAVIWFLSLLLLTAALRPSRAAELAILVGGSLALGTITDRLLRWPRGPALPAATAVVAYAVDLAFGSPLIVRSLLGPSPRSGARFYGLGNELEVTLPVLLFVVLAGLLWGRGRSRPAAAAFAVSGVALGAIMGSGRLGADVGAVITLGAGAAVATVAMLPGRLRARTLVLAAFMPVLALVALALLDLATGGNGHFTRTVLRADDGRALLDLIARRYTLAFNQLISKAMPFLSLLAVLGAAYAYRYRERVYAPLCGSPPWRALLLGGLAGAVVGTLSNDSGPVLLVYGVALLTVLTAYVRGDPALSEHD